MSVSALVGEVVIRVSMDVEDALQVGLRPYTAIEWIFHKIIVVHRGLLALVYDPLQ